MAGEWTNFRLGDVCTKIGSGATPRGGSSVYLDRGDVTLIRSQNIYNDGFHRDGLVYLTKTHADELANVEVSEGDVLLNITGDSVARVCRVARDVLPARVNQHVAIIRPDPKRLSPLYLRYYLVSATTQAEMLSLAGAGATRNALTKGMIESFNVAAPADVGEQLAIAHILGTLDDKIELNRRMNETLEAMARALFKSWFVDFDPVRAKMNGRQPEGMDKATAALFPDSFEDSALGKIPKGWEVNSISEVTIRVTKGDTPRTDAIQSAPIDDPLIPMLRVNAITERGEILLDKAEFIPKSIHLGKSKRSILEANDVLYTNAGTIGRVAFVEEELLPANTNQAVAIIRPNSAIVPPAFLFMLMRQPEFQERLHCKVIHAVQPNLALGMISEAQGVFPPAKTLAKLFEPIERCLRTIWQNRRESRNLAALRDALLPKLLSGEIQVRSAEDMVGRTI